MNLIIKCQIQNGKKRQRHPQTSEFELVRLVVFQGDLIVKNGIKVRFGEKVWNTHYNVFRVKTSGYDSRRTILWVHEVDLTFELQNCHWQCSTTRANDEPSFEKHSIIRFHQLRLINLTKRLQNQVSLPNHVWAVQSLVWSMLCRGGCIV